MSETDGIRRTFFPTRTQMELPRGQLSSVEGVQLADADSRVPVQATVTRRWDDGSVRTLEVDFNVSIGPLETQAFDLLFDADGEPVVGGPRGLVIDESPEGLQVGRIRFGSRGSIPLASVDYRGELIADGENGLVIVDDVGTRYEASSTEWEPVELLKGGPLTVHVRHRGTLQLRQGGSVEITLDLEMPNSKSWVRLEAQVEDPDRHIREIGFATPLNPGEYPWTWDFGTPNGTYGAFRDESGWVVLQQTVETGGRGRWEVRTGAEGGERIYEQSLPGRSEVVKGWAHLQNGTQAIAFAIEGVGPTPGVFTARLSGLGQAEFSFSPMEPSERQSLVVYQHFVSVPVAIGAATSPASILSPPNAVVEILP